MDKKNEGQQHDENGQGNEWSARRTEERTKDLWKGRDGRVREEIMKKYIEEAKEDE